MILRGNEMDIKVSIIIPAYNVEKYIEECLDSAIGQTLKEIEIIVVNDGSVDNTKRIIEGYADRDERIIIVNQENKGLSATRNKGASLAEGEYIYFFDSDDFISPNAMETLYNNAVKNNLDIVAGKHIEFNDKEIKFSEIKNKEEYASVKDNTCIQFDTRKYISVNKYYGVVVWKYMIKREFWNKLSFGFLEGYEYEDSEFTPKCLLSAELIGQIEFQFYFYRRTQCSFTLKGMTVSKCRSIRKVVENLDQFYTEKCLQKPYDSYLSRIIATDLMQAIGHSVYCSKALVGYPAEAILKKFKFHLKNSNKYRHKVLYVVSEISVEAAVFFIRKRYRYIK